MHFGETRPHGRSRKHNSACACISRTRDACADVVVYAGGRGAFNFGETRAHGRSRKHSSACACISCTRGACADVVLYAGSAARCIWERPGLTGTAANTSAHVYVFYTLGMHVRMGLCTRGAAARCIWEKPGLTGEAANTSAHVYVFYALGMPVRMGLCTRGVRARCISEKPGLTRKARQHYTHRKICSHVMQGGGTLHLGVTRPHLQGSATIHP